MCPCLQGSRSRCLPDCLIVISSYYVLFEVMGGTTRALIIESSVMTAFLIGAVAGFKRNLWLVAAALVGHGVFDFFHAGVVTNAGVPEYWPAFCMSYDVGAGVCLAWLLMHAKITARPAAHMTEKLPRISEEPT